MWVFFLTRNMLKKFETLGITCLERKLSRSEVKKKTNWVAKTALVEVLKRVDIKKAYPIKDMR